MAAKTSFIPLLLLASLSSAWAGWKLKEMLQEEWLSRRKKGAAESGW